MFLSLATHLFALKIDRRYTTFVRIDVTPESPPEADANGNMVLHCTSEPFRSEGLVVDNIELTHEGPVWNRLGFASFDSSDEVADNSAQAKVGWRHQFSLISNGGFAEPRSAAGETGDSRIKVSSMAFDKYFRPVLPVFPILF
ncbi:MAG TPA: hypothetical protein VFC78_23555 [Tepidisphaeraceae bacterium]|nr:hypothetical protein [Tepidisphaeraceae bacterium]